MERPTCQAAGLYSTGSSYLSPLFGPLQPCPLPFCPSALLAAVHRTSFTLSQYTDSSKQAGRQAGRQADRQADRQANKLTYPSRSRVHMCVVCMCSLVRCHFGTVQNTPPSCHLPPAIFPSLSSFLAMFPCHLPCPSATGSIPGLHRSLDWDAGT